MKADKKQLGASLVEYTIAVSGVLLVCITAMLLLGEEVRAKYESFTPALFG